MSIWNLHHANATPAPCVPVISIANLKGGVGKTTLAANLACALVHSEHLRVLAIDFDFQGSLSEALPHVVERTFKPGSINLLRSEDIGVLFDLDTTTPGFGVAADMHIIQSFYHLAEIEDRLMVRFIMDGAKDPLDTRQILARKLSSTRVRADYDIVIIDTPPRLSMATINALAASSHIIIPTSITPLSISATITFSDTINSLRRNFPSLNPIAIIPTITQTQNLATAEVNNLAVLESQLPSLPVWRDCLVPRKADISRNESYFKSIALQEIFDPIARKIRQACGAVRNDRSENIRSHPSFKSTRDRAH